METRTFFLFPPFRLELDSEQLWREDQEIPLRPKTFAVLRALVEHSGQLLTKERLLATVWAETVVSDNVLKSCIHELRIALGDDVQTPQYIATVPRRGYRFLPSVTTQPVPRSTFKVPSSPPPASDSTKKVPASFPLGTWNLEPETFLVGRESELAQLHNWLEKALRGERQIVFITGEPGIGKTTLVEAFRQRLETGDWRLAPSSQASSLKPPASPVSFAHGQCIEHYGAGEAYLPVLEALGRLCRESEGQRVIELLSQHAPTWLGQMPGLLSTPEFEALQRRTQGVTRDRMLRELLDALEALTVERPIILCLEDLHWSDVSTVDFLSALARRREHCRLLALGTYRPMDVIMRDHPLRAVKYDLQMHGHCRELAMRLLSEAHIAQYLAGRWEANVGANNYSPLPRLARAIHQRTDGNPLFMVNVVDSLLARGALDHVGEAGLTAPLEVPENIHQMIEEQLQRLGPEEQYLLEAASVMGADFSAAAVAAGVEKTVNEVEAYGTELARRGQFIEGHGVSEWPDGTLATRYRFLHAVYHDVLYERIPASQRINLHKHIGERIEQAYGEHAREVAAELAVHFERGRDYRKAAHYLQHAGQNAMQRAAHQEAIQLLNRGLELLKSLPDTPERAQQELSLQYALGTALIITKGVATPEVVQIYTRTQALCQQVGATPPLFWVQLRLWNSAFYKMENPTQRQHAEQLLPLPYKGHDLTARLPPLLTRGVTLFFLGEMVQARAQLEEGVALYVPQQHRSVFHGIACLAHAAQTLWFLGYPDQALTSSTEALALAQEVSQPYSLAFARHWMANLHCLRGEVSAVHAQAEVLLARSTTQDLSEWSPMGALWRGWTLAMQGKGTEGLAQLRQGIATRRTLGAELWWTYYLALFAQACGKNGQVEEGLNLLTEALTTVAKTGERFYEAEIYRLKGQLTLQHDRNQGPGNGDQKKDTDPQPLIPNLQAEAEAEACFLKAIDIARKQRAKALELRATMSLAHLWQQGKTKQAHEMLADIYNWFTEGFDTKDLQEARALLEELRH